MPVGGMHMPQLCTGSAYVCRLVSCALVKPCYQNNDSAAARTLYFFLSATISSRRQISPSML